MDLGIFLPIANNGWIMSKYSPQYMPTFELNKTITVMAEEMGMEFVLSMVKYRGYGGETEHWDYALESFTLMAGLASATKRIELYASVQPLTLHPAMAARMAVTIDDISGGRFGINVVAGWNKYEYSQMGLWPGDEFYGSRYEYADEWVDVVRRLWLEGRATYKGEYFELEDCLCQPQPRRIPPIVCAGMSDRGLEFTIKRGDINFVAGSLEDIQMLSEKGKKMAAKLGKSIKTFAVYTIIAADTDEEALAIYRHFIDGTDTNGFAGMQEAKNNDKGGSTVDKLLNQIFIVPPIVGSPDTVAQYLERIQRETLVDGVLFTFPDFVTDLAYFGNNIMPILEARGLRPFVAERTEKIS